MKALALLIALTAATSASGQQFVYPKADPTRFSVQRDVRFKDPGGAPLAFDLYRPAGKDVVPVAITCNVGIQGMRSHPVYTGWGEAVSSQGLAMVHYDASDDERGSFDALMEALRARAGELRIDPTRVVLWGASANVQFCLPLAMDRSRPYVRGAVLYYGNGETAEFRTDLPVLFIRAGLDNPWLNGEIDKLLARAVKANAPWTVVNYAGGLHAFEMLNDTALSRHFINQTIGFMKDAVSDPIHAAYLASADEATLGGAYVRGEWQTAAEGYGKRVAANPNDAESHLRLGIALDNLGRSAEGLAAIERAFELGRGGPRDTMVPAARAAARSKNQARALYWSERALQSRFITADELRQEPALAAVLDSAAGVELVGRLDTETRAAALLAEGKSTEGLALLASAPEHVLNAVGYRLLGQKKVGQAVPVFEEATRRFPQSANAWDSFSEALEASGRKEDAVRAARQALTLNPPPPVRAASEDRIARLSRK